MAPDRRTVLAALGAASLAGSGCAGAARRRVAASWTRPGRAALLLPLTGPNAEVGRSMERGARLAQPPGDDESLPTIDTAGGAGAAAARAVAGGAEVLLGPLFARDVAAVVAGAGGRPVLAFTNDARAAGSGAFVLGVTASQSASALIRYARERGLRETVVAGGDSAWSRQALEAAQAAGANAGLTVRAETPERLVATLDAEPPQSVLLAEADAASLAAAGPLAAAGVQLLLSSAWADAPESVLRTLSGAWLSGPDPQRFAGFAERYRTRWQAEPGRLAALAYDAVLISRTARLAGGDLRAQLTRAEGFNTVTGPLRLEANGRCVREMTTAVVVDGTLRVVARAAAA